jgi:peptidoglycan hydrolase-like protein with peptidoglycan-binding domain
MIDARREAARDLSEREPWELSLGRSRARRRAAQLRFVPASSRAKRLSLGALVALTAGAGSGSLLLDSGGVQVAGAAPAEPEPITTTQHTIVLSPGSEGRQVRLLQRALGIPVDGVYGPQTEAAVRRFQATRGLTVDGIVGSLTSRALAVHAPPVLSGGAVLRELDGEARESAPGEVQESVSSSSTPAGGSDLAAAADTLEDPAAATGAGTDESAGASGTDAGAPAAPASTTGAGAGSETGGTASVGEAAGEAANVNTAPSPEDPGVYATPAILEGSGGTAAAEEGEAAGAAQTGGATQTAADHSGAGGTGASQTGADQAGTDQTAAGQTGADQTAAGQTGADQTVAGQTADSQTGAGQTGAGQSSTEPQTAGATETLAEVARASREHAAAETHALAAATDAVKRLQSSLHVAVDGEFGPETEAALRRLQAREGLSVDGIAGPATWRALGQHSQPELVPPPSALPHPRHVGSPRDHQQNHDDLGGLDIAATTPHPAGRPSRGQAVRSLQEALHVSVDGEFGPETETAVRHFQEAHGLEVDGVVGPATWAALGLSGQPELNPPRAALAAGGSTSSTGGGSSPGSTSSTGEGVVQRVIAAANEIATRPYVYGGGHGSFISEGYDCSGSVSYALHGGGLLSAPEDSTGLESYGEPGPGRYITIYANAEHAYMVIDGRRFDTVALAETGSRWSDSPGDDGGDFVERHPDGL